MTKITRRSATAGLAGATMFAPALVRAQGAYPAGLSMKMLVPFPPGGSTDIVGRAMADALAALWKTNIVVENVSGAGANIGMDRAAKGPTDGSTILVVPPNFTTNQYLYNKMPFDAEKDIIPISHVSALSNLLVVRKGLSDIKTVKDLIEAAKKDPGKLTYASSGVGTTIYLSAELFKRMAGVNLTHVAYRGSSLALNDLVADKVDVMFDNLPSVYPQVKGGNLNGIAVTQASKSRFAPEFPTVAETLPGFNVQSWFGLGVRAGTPTEIMQKIEADVQAVCKLPEVRQRLETAGMETIGSNKAGFDQWIADERKRWGTLISELKIKVD